MRLKTLLSFANTPLHKSALVACLCIAMLSSCSSSDDSDDETTGTTVGATDEQIGGQTDGQTDGQGSGQPDNPIDEENSSLVLGDLPNPPLSEPPSANDEPVAEDASLNTVVGLQIVRDTGPQIVKAEPAEFTDADFDAGPLPAQIETPIDVDPLTNTAPDFENLVNVDAVAGEQLAIVYKPFDVDGELPGMFPVELPKGSSFDDNFDGSKTYRWQPLENDVGISSFSVTAIDPQNSEYRNTRTILIRVSLPEDLSSIPNVAPTLEPFTPHTARVNDPVVLELQGLDLNGAVPTMSLISDLPESSFAPHPRLEGTYTLRFVPDTEGDTTIDVLVIDSIDPSLTTTETVTLQVLAESAFERSGQRLRELATARGIQFGYASVQEYYHRPDGGIYADIAAAEFNLVSPENAMKMDAINPSPGRYQFADIDNLVAFANQNGMAVHGHPVLWYTQLPAWIEAIAPENLEGHMREYIDRLMGRYQNDIQFWDVVNEPIGENGGFRESIWFQAMGEEYLDIAFAQAKASAPNAELIINDFDIAFNGPKADTLFEMLESLQNRDVPIDGVGFQLHVFNTFNQFDEVRANFARVAALGLDIYITELDVGLAGDGNLEAQADVFGTIVEICLEQPRCKAIQTWGFTDQYSFRENVLPLMFDKAYQPKPAYQAIQDALAN